MPLQIPITKAPDNPLQFIQLTDSHLLQDPEQIFAGVSPFKSLQAVLADIQHEHHLQDIDGILSTGDIAQEPALQTYQQYIDAVAQLNKPHFIIPGNHDEPALFPPSEHSDAPIVILAGTWCIIMLDSQLDRCIYGEISTAHLIKLQQILDQYQHSHHVLLALHHHTFPVGSAWLDQHILKNSADFLACIAPYSNVKLVISGHVHQDFEHQHNGVVFLSTPSTFVQFKPKSQQFGFDSRSPGYRLLNLYANGDFTTQVYHLAESIGNIDHSMSEY